MTFTVTGLVVRTPPWPPHRRSHLIIPGAFPAARPARLDFRQRHRSHQHLQGIVLRARVTTNVIPPITIAVPTGQTPVPRAPTGQVFQQLPVRGRLHPERWQARHFPVCHEDGTISGWNSQAGTQSIIAVDEANTSG